MPGNMNYYADDPRNIAKIKEINADLLKDRQKFDIWKAYILEKKRKRKDRDDLIIKLYLQGISTRKISSQVGLGVGRTKKIINESINSKR